MCKDVEVAKRLSYGFFRQLGPRKFRNGTMPVKYTITTMMGNSGLGIYYASIRGGGHFQKAHYIQSDMAARSNKLLFHQLEASGVSSKLT